MSTKQLQHWLNKHTAFQDRGPSFRVFTTVLILFHMLAILFVWIFQLLN